jgi:dephospho-CoA kinase
MLVIGGIGAGKSTVLNILNSQGLGGQRQDFVASNQLRGCT